MHRHDEAQLWPPKPSISSTQWWDFSIFSSHSTSPPYSTAACLRSTIAIIQAMASSMSSDPHLSYPSTHITQSPFRQTHTHLARSTPTRSSYRRPPLVSISLFPNLSLTLSSSSHWVYHVYIVNKWFFFLFFWFLVVLSIYFEIFWYNICLEVEKMTEKLWKICRKIAFSKCYQTLEIVF